MQAFKNFRVYFLRGLAALLPTILTIWIFFQGYRFVDENISVHINRGIAKVLVATMETYPPVTQQRLERYAVEEFPRLSKDSLAQKMQEEEVIDGARIEVAEQYWVNGKGQIAGIIIVFLGICFLGAFLASFVGKTLWHFFEKALINAPIVRLVYPHIKQVTDFMLTKKEMAFKKVVAIQYPRKGVWSLGLVTGNGLKKISGKLEKEFLTVFVPTSPTPFTGYVIMTPTDETIEVEMSIEEAIRFTISAGVITPAEHAAFQALSNKEEDDDV